MAGPLPDTDTADVEGGAPPATVSIATPVPAPEARAPAGSALGRFVVLDELGAGGMGLVVRAYDPKLRREVALKLLKAPGTEAVGRILQEAQAMARLSHPNVISVFDVGEHHGDVFIAMEYVEGHTLRRWSARMREDWRGVLRVLVQAGRGLVAAHERGVVHRDFKPDNVMVGDDGRVRVMDFGLARGVSEASPELRRDSELVSRASTESVERPDSDSVPVSEMQALTPTGVLLGTPPYMAPEQHRNSACDARSDQFAFCVAGFEALYGRRPFVGKSLRRLYKAKTRGAVEPPPAETPVPAWVHSALLRGLSSEPEHRWASMEELLSILDRAPRRRWWWGAGATCTVLGAIAAAAWVRDAPSPCSGAEAYLVDAYDERRRADVEASLLATRVPFARDTWEHVDEELVRYRSDWVDAYVGACEATKVHGDQSDGVLDARMRCLHNRRLALQALSETFNTADAEIVENASRAVGDLPRIERCNDVGYVLAQIPPPDDPKLEAKVEALRGRLAHVEALHSAGKYRYAMDSLHALVLEVDALNYDPLRIEVRYRGALLAQELGRYEEAAKGLHEAFFEARRVGMDELAANAAMTLVLVLSTDLARYEDALAWAKHARVETERFGDSLAEATLAANLGGLYHAMGKYDDALEASQRALSIREKEFGPDHPILGQSHRNLGIIRFERGEYDQAMAHLRRALELDQARHGPRHPRVGETYGTLANMYLTRGEFRRAEELFGRNLAILNAAFGPEHPSVGRALHNLGSVFFSEGDYATALEHYERALAIRVGVLGPNHPDVGETLGNVGSARFELGDLDGAQSAYERALVIAEQTHGSDHPQIAFALTNLAGVDASSGRHAQAHGRLRDALRVYEGALSPDHPSIGTTLMLLGGELLALGRADEAVAAHERAVRLLPVEDFPLDGSAARFGLARALWETGSDRERAVALAREAERGYSKLGGVAAREHDDALGWIRENAAHDR